MNTFRIEPSFIANDKIHFEKTDEIKNITPGTIIIFSSIGTVSYSAFINNIKIKDTTTYFIPKFILEPIIKTGPTIHPFTITKQFDDIKKESIEKLLSVIKKQNPNKEILNYEKGSLNESECCELCKAFSIVLNVIILSEELEKLFPEIAKEIIRKRLENVTITDELISSFIKSKPINIPFDIGKKEKYIQITIKNNMSIINKNNVFLWNGMIYLPFKLWLEEIYPNGIKKIAKQKINTSLKGTEIFEMIKNSISELLPKKVIYKSTTTIPSTIPSIDEALKNNLFPPCVQSWINQLKTKGCKDQVRRSTRTFFDLGYNKQEIETFFRKNGATDKHVKEMFSWTNKIEQDSEIVNKRNGIFNKSCGKRCKKLISDANDLKDNETHYTCPLVNKDSIREFTIGDIEDLGERLKNIKENSNDLCKFYFGEDPPEFISSPTDFFIKKLNRLSIVTK